MGKKKVVIIGAGLAGLSAAWHLAKKGIDAEVFEKESEAGGLCRSKRSKGFTFDYDGHLLHFRHRYTFELVGQLLKGNLLKHSRNAWVYSCGRYTRYPFQANLYGLPSAIVAQCLLGFIKASRSRTAPKPDTFLEWILATFGEGIAKYFMVPYNTKFWTLPPEKMTCAWLDGFVPVPSLPQLVAGTVDESKSSLGYNAHFWYPQKGGISRLPAALSRQVAHIHTDCAIVRIDPQKKELLTARGDRVAYDILVLTAPLPELARLIRKLPSESAEAIKQLRWNSIFNLNLAVDKKDFLGRHWIYFPDREINFFRVGFFHNFSAHAAPQGKSALYAEVSYSEEKPLDKSRAVAQITEHLRKVGILAQGEGVLFEDSNDIQYGYPIYDRNYQGARGKILSYLSGRNIIPAGRYGSWRYMSMEDVLLEGRCVAEEVYTRSRGNNRLYNRVF